MYSEAMFYRSDKSFVFKWGNRLLVTSFLFCISSKQPGLIKRRRRISGSHRKQNCCREREVNLFVLSSGTRNRWKKWKEVVWQIFNNKDKIDHPKMWNYSHLLYLFFFKCGRKSSGTEWKQKDWRGRNRLKTKGGAVLTMFHLVSRCFPSCSSCAAQKTASRSPARDLHSFTYRPRLLLWSFCSD